MGDESCFTSREMEGNGGQVHTGAEGNRNLNHAARGYVFAPGARCVF